MVPGSAYHVAAAGGVLYPLPMVQIMSVTVRFDKQIAEWAAAHGPTGTIRRFRLPLGRYVAGGPSTRATFCCPFPCKGLSAVKGRLYLLVTTSSVLMYARYLFVVGFVALVLGLAASPVNAQAAYQPDFDLEVISVRGDEGEAHLDVYTSIPYQNLRFLATESGFRAAYVVTANVYHLNADNSEGGLLLSRTWERAVEVEEYDETQEGGKADQSVQSIEAPPGRYLVEVTTEDEASRRTFAREVALRVAPTDAAFSISDPLLVRSYDPATRRIEPNVGGAISTEEESAMVYYEIYASTPRELQVTYSVTERNRVEDRPSFRALLGLATDQRVEQGTPVLVTEPLSVPAGRTPATFQIDTENLQVGEYMLGIRIESVEGATLAEASRPVAVKWMGLDAQIANLEDAIRQLRYIAKSDEMRAMTRAESPEEQLRLFQEFWETRDPTPGTSRNERMEEYYFRVSYANERYSRFHEEGWNTDRGEVFITFGDPDYVENHPFGYGTEPYQIWYYESRGRRFIFVDEHGTGDFQLAIPIWDDRTRM